MPFRRRVAQLGPMPALAAHFYEKLWAAEILTRFHSVREAIPDHWTVGGHVVGLTTDGWWVEYKDLVHGVGLSVVKENEMQQTARNEDIAYITHMLQHVLRIEELTNGLVDPTIMAMQMGNLLRNYPPQEKDGTREYPQRLELDIRAFLMHEPPPGEETLLEVYGGPEQTLPGLNTQQDTRVLFYDNDPEAGLRPEWLVGPDESHRCMIIKANADCTVGLDLLINAQCNIPRDEIIVKRAYFSEFDLLDPTPVLFKDNDFTDDFLLEDIIIPPADGQLIRGMYLHIHCIRPQGAVQGHNHMMQCHGDDPVQWTIGNEDEDTAAAIFPDMPYLIMVVDDRAVIQYLAFFETMHTVLLGTHKRVGADSLFSRWDIGIDILSHIFIPLQPKSYKVCLLLYFDVDV
jgi:hypothetical protein